MQKVFVNLLYRLGTQHHRKLIFALVGVVVFMLVRSTTWWERAYYSTLERDETRGAATVSWDVFNDKFTSVKYLTQGWTPADSVWYYTTTQGSDLLPYDFFLALEQKDSKDGKDLFRSAENMNRLRYLPQNKTPGNEDALPVGMVADEYRGKKYLGFTCAACHSSQVNHNGVGLRIDGGPGAADMDAFMNELAESLRATSDDPAKKERFIKTVLAGPNYSDRAAVEADLAKYALQLETYNFFNDTDAPYGYARLDAFGRIYNRVLEHVLDAGALEQAFLPVLGEQNSKQYLADLKRVISLDQRDQLLEKLAQLPLELKRKLRDRLFHKPNAPVSYPFVWDIPQHDYVQWNGIGANGGNKGVGPVGRNTGEVIGVFGTLDWAERSDWWPSRFIAALGGQSLLARTYIDFRSSVDVHNLRKIEERLMSLQSPQWTEAAELNVLPKINETLAATGAPLFEKHCAACHANINRTDRSRRVVAHMDSLDEVNTDRTMAENSVGRIGYSGILRNLYMEAGVGNVLLDTKAPVAAILTTATQNVVGTPDPDKWFLTRAADWAVNLAAAAFTNPIRPSVKNGTYKPDTTRDPFQSLLAYKGRSLNGIWATAPYLHNGSVPTLYHLLLPEADRPKQFMVGSREFDPEYVGFRFKEEDYGKGKYQGFRFDTTLNSNSNAGHTYGTKLSDPERRALVEYLKGL